MATKMNEFVDNQHDHDRQTEGGNIIEAKPPEKGRVDEVHANDPRIGKPGFRCRRQVVPVVGEMQRKKSPFVHQEPMENPLHQRPNANDKECEKEVDQIQFCECQPQEDRIDRH